MIRNVVKQRIISYDQLEQQLLEAIQREDAATAAVEEKLSKDEVTSATEVGQGKISPTFSSATNTGTIKDDPYWTSRKNSLELIELSSINKVSLV
jgi:hypothetical protein